MTSGRTHIEKVTQTDRPVEVFPIVCVGGSAGGLDAYTRLLQNLPADLGVAIVIVNHMRSMPTRLHEILPSYTSMPVDLITEGLSIEANHVFIIPENRDLHVDHGQFRLKPVSKPRGWPDVITVFLRSLTDLLGRQAGCRHRLRVRRRRGRGTVRDQRSRGRHHRPKARHRAPAGHAGECYRQRMHRFRSFPGRHREKTPAHRHFVLGQRGDPLGVGAIRRAASSLSKSSGMLNGLVM